MEESQIVNLQSDELESNILESDELNCMNKHKNNKDDKDSSARVILSFVRRSARLDARLERAKERYSSQYLLNVEDSLGSLRVKSDLLVDSN